MCFGSDCFAQLPIVAQYGRFRGGAVYASDIEIYGSILGGNEAPGKSGGAVYLREGGKSLIVNTVIYNNTASTGSAYYAESGSTSQLINNTIVRNAHAENVSGDVTSGSTVYSASTAGNNLTNTVIWGNDDAERINADHWEIITSAADVDEDAGNFEVFLDRANEAVMASVRISQRLCRSGKLFRFCRFLSAFALDAG